MRCDCCNFALCTYLARSLVRTALMLNEIIRAGHCQLDLSCSDAHHLLCC